VSRIAADRDARRCGAGLLGRLYFADLAGASAGTLVSGLVLLPLAGAGGVVLAVAGLKLLSWIGAARRL
jgi:hypothetical protein